MASSFTITESLKPMERLLDGISLTAQRSRQAALAALFITLSVIYMSYNYISTYRNYYSDRGLYSTVDIFRSGKDFFTNIDNIIEKIKIPDTNNKVKPPISDANNKDKPPISDTNNKFKPLFANNDEKNKCRIFIKKLYLNHQHNLDEMIAESAESGVNNFCMSLFLYHKDHIKIKDQIMKNIIDSAFLNHPILGIKFMFHDLLNYSLFGFIIIYSWYYINVRRENYLIADLFGSIDNEIINNQASQNEQNEKLYKMSFSINGVISAQMFSSIYSSSNHIKNYKKFIRREKNFLLKKQDGYKENSIKLRDFISTILIFAPLIVSFSKLIFDFVINWEEGNLKNIYMASEKQDQLMIDVFLDKLKIYMGDYRAIVEVILLIVLGGLTYQIFKYHKAIQSLILQARRSYAKLYKTVNSPPNTSRAIATS